MKITKLLEAFITDVIRKTSPNRYKQKTINRAENSPKRNDITSGLYGRIHQDSNDPHMVHKLNHSIEYVDGDPYFVYMDTVIKGEYAQENPYFPRAYKVSSVTDKQTQGRYKIKMEKLIPFTDLNIEQLLAVSQKFFESESELDELMKEIDNMKKAHDTEYEIQRQISIYLSDMIADIIEDKGQIDDAAFNQMVNILHYIKSDNENYVWDLHSGNMMFRLTPHGPQLVITDPFC